MEALVFPTSIWAKVLRTAHDGTGHLGHRKVLQLVKRKFVWPLLARCIANLVLFVRGTAEPLLGEPHGRASRALRAFRADGLRPCRSPPEGQRRILICADSGLCGDEMAGGDPLEERNGKSSSRRDGKHLQQNSHPPADPFGSRFIVLEFSGKRIMQVAGYTTAEDHGLPSANKWSRETDARNSRRNADKGTG